VLLSQVFLERFENTQTTDGSMALTSAVLGAILFYRLRLLRSNLSGITGCVWKAGVRSASITRPSIGRRANYISREVGLDIAISGGRMGN
jgi:hypothetical protein